MPAIQSLKPRLTQAEAVQRFRGGLKLPGWLGGARLTSVADAYVPYHLYEVEVASGARPYASWLAVDAVTGALDPYQFEHPPTAQELTLVETRNRPRPALDESQTLALLEQKVRRIVYQTGFFRVRALRIRATRLAGELHVPYWLGFYERGGALRLRVLDAVRRRFEGGKARALFEGWLSTSARPHCRAERSS